MNHLPQIEIDPGSGFCFGVVTAITKAEEELHQSGSLYCLGDIVHNNTEVDRLCSRGLVTITHRDLEKLHDVKVLLRAHGEPPSTYSTAEKNGIKIIDATCPVVLRLQRRIKSAHADHPASEGAQIVIYGKKGHAEVNGLVGQTGGRAIVVQSIDELSAIDFGRDIYLYSQTTKSIEGFHNLIDEIKRRKKSHTTFEYHDTICRQVANRVGALRAFAADHDVVIFVSGAKSSNGKVLYNECHSVNPATRLISTPEEIDPSWLEGAETIGICGATSTPRWLMERVRDHLTSLY